MSLEEQMFRIYGPIVVIGLIIAWRLRTMSRERPLDPSRLWILPLILIGLTGWILVQAPPGLLGLAICALSLAAGLAVGWQRGKLIRLWADPETGALMQKASPAALLLLVAVLLTRLAIRRYVDLNPSADGQLHGQALVVTDALLTFAVGLIVATRIELIIRARQILAAAQGIPK